MNPIDSVGPIGPAPTDLKKVLDVQPTAGPSMETLTQRFQTMMSQEPGGAEPADGANAIGKVLEKDQALEQRKDDMMQHMTAHSDTMSPHELAALSREYVRTSSISSFRLQAISSLATSTNKSLQTLLKNS